MGDRIEEQVKRWLAVVAAAYAAGAEEWTAEGITATRVKGGFNNALFQVEADGRHYGCKLCVVDERRRAAREYGTLRALEAAGLDIAPHPLWLDESCGTLTFPTVIYRWLPGEPVPPTPSEKQLTALLESIHQMQSLPSSPLLPNSWFHWFDFDVYLEEIRSYLPRFGPWLRENNPDGGSICGRMADLLDRCAEIVASTTADPSQKSVPLRLCRSDTNLANSVWGQDDRVRWVDWEYSGWGDPALELAELRWHVAYVDLSPAQHTWLREHYRQPAGDGGFEKRLAVWDSLIVTRWCLLILRTLWNAYNGPDRPRLSQLELDADQLRARLVRFIEQAERTTHTC